MALMVEGDQAGSPRLLGRGAGAAMALSDPAIFFNPCPSILPGEDLDDDRRLGLIDGAVHVPMDLEIGIAERAATCDEAGPGLLSVLVRGALGGLPPLARSQHGLQEGVHLTLLVVEGDFPAVQVAIDGDPRITQPLDD